MGLKGSVFSQLLVSTRSVRNDELGRKLVRNRAYKKERNLNLISKGRNKVPGCRVLDCGVQVLKSKDGLVSYRRPRSSSGDLDQYQMLSMRGNILWVGISGEC